MTLGEQIKAYRQKAGLSQEHLAEALHVSRQAITKWETDKGLPDIDNLIALSEKMGVTLDSLVKGEAAVAKKAADKRAVNRKLNVINALVFFTVFLLWVYIGCLNLESPHTFVPVLNFITAAVALAVALMHTKLYLSSKEQG